MRLNGLSLVFIYAGTSAAVLTLDAADRAFRRSVLDWLDGPNASGWVQAWGALAALIATFVVVWYQGRQAQIQAEAQRRAVKRERLMTVRGVLQHVSAVYTILATTFESADPQWSAVAEEVDEAISGLDSLRSSPFDLPHHELVWRLDLLIQNLRFARRLLRAEIADAGGVGAEILVGLQQQRSKVDAAAAWCVMQAHALGNKAEQDELVAALNREQEYWNE